jgi:periodic tryptophan protein 1
MHFVCLRRRFAAGAPQDTDGMDSAMAELNMDKYDDDEGEDGGVRGIFGNTNPGMAYYGADQEDPYIQLSAVKDEDSEAEDFEIRGDDYILLAARNEDDVSHLEVRLLPSILFASLQ